MSTGVEQAQPAGIDDRCLRCGYDLRGIANDQPCTECGLLAERSRNRSEHLADAPPWLIRRLAIGSQLLLLSVLCVVGWIVLMITDNTFHLAIFRSASAGHWLYAGYDLAVLSWILGAWLLTIRGPSSHQANMPQGLRRWFRRLSPLLFGAMLLVHGYDEIDRAVRLRLPWTPQSTDWYWWWARWSALLFAIVIWLCVSVNGLLGFLWLRRLAQRVLNSNLAEHSAIVGVGFALSSGMLILFASTYDWLETVQPLKNKTWTFLSAAIIAALFACVITCALWSLLNLVRFSLAFRRAARESRGRWRVADRAAADFI